MPRIVRLYSPEVNEIIAPHQENSGRLEGLSPEIAHEISCYYELYLPYVRGEKPLHHLKARAGNQYDTTLYEPAAADPFLVRSYDNEPMKLPGYLHTVGAMAFLVDRRVARVLSEVAVGPALKAASHAFRQIITSVRKGKMVTEAPAKNPLPTHQIKTMLESIFTMRRKGVSLDPNPHSVLYDPDDGFTVTRGLPMGNLIAPPPEADFEEAKLLIESMNRAFPREKKLILKPTVSKRTVAEDVFDAAKCMVHARMPDHPKQLTLKNAATYGNENADFQKLLLETLSEVLGIIKFDFPACFPECKLLVEHHLEMLEHTFADDLEITVKINRLKLFLIS